MSVSATVVMQAELAGAGGGWTDISADVNIGVDSIAVSYGIRGGGPLDRVANVGSMSWSMNNSTTNSGGVLGYYTPGHTNARSGWEVGVIVRLAITYSGTTYYKFYGTLVSITPDAGIYQQRSVACVAHDWISEAANCLLRDMSVQLAKRSDQVFSTILSASHHRQPPATSIATGQSTFAVSLDNVRDESTVGLRGLADVTMAEGGFMYVKGDTVQGGTLVFEDRHARPLKTSSATFVETMFELGAVRSRADIFNRSNVIIHPRKIDALATTVLYSLTPTTSMKPSIIAGATLAFTGLYRDATGQFVRVGGDEIVTPVATTDYLGNSQADGLGSDLTASLGLVFASSGNSATFTFTNNHPTATIYLTSVQVRGKAVQDRYEVSVFSKDDTSATAYGERDFTYDMIFEDSIDVGAGFAEWMVSLYGNPRMVIASIGIKGNRSDALMIQALAREPGDKITVTESMTGIAANTYFINGVQLTVDAGGEITASWVLAPADQSQAWILEDAVAGLLGASTYLGFV